MQSIALRTHQRFCRIHCLHKFARRMGKAEEAAAIAVFLLSDEASFVTGSDYAVDGGEAQL
jgi:NAD(P)-dependent dehydrogenase (short-subunit alcohol dehydrogenase family)